MIWYTEAKPRGIEHVDMCFENQAQADAAESALRKVLRSDEVPEHSDDVVFCVWLECGFPIERMYSRRARAS